MSQTSRFQRSRNGCLACRRKRKKCDEKRPSCSRCERTDSDCTWALPLASGSDPCIDFLDSHGTKCDRLGPLHASTGDTTITGVSGAPSTQNTPRFLLSLTSSCDNNTWHELQPPTTQHMSQDSEGSRPQFLYATNSEPTFVPAPASIPSANAVSDALANAKPSRAIDWNHVRDYAALIFWPPEDAENDDAFDPEGAMPVVRLSISVLNTPSDSLFRELHKFFESFLPRYFYDYAMFDDTLMIRIRRRFEVSDSIKRGMLGTAILFRSNYERSVLTASLRNYAKELHILAMNSLKLELDSTRIPIQAKLASMMELTNHEYYAGNLVTYYHHLNQAALLIRIIMGGRAINLLTLSGEQTFDIRWFCWGDILSSMALSRPTLLDYEFDVHDQYSPQLHNVKSREYMDPDKGIEWIFGCPDILAVLLARTTALRHAHLSVKEKVSEGSKIEQLIRNCQFAPVRAKQSTLRVARLGAQEVWRQIAILYAHEAIFKSNSSHPAVKDSVKSIVRIATTLRPGYNPDCFLAVPYFIAGFFATSEKDRFFLRDRILTCGNEHYLRHLAASLDDLWQETDSTPGGLASWARKQPPRFMF